MQQAIFLSQLPVQTLVLHTLLIGMVSAAHAAAVPCPGKATRISRKGQSTYNNNISDVSGRRVIANRT